MNKARVSSHRTQAEFVLAFDTDTSFQLCGFTPAQRVNVYPLNTGQLTLKCQFQDIKTSPKVNNQAQPGWGMSGTQKFQPKIIAATFLIVRFSTFVSKLTIFIL